MNRIVSISLAVGIILLSSLQAEYYPPIFDFGIGIGYRHDNYKMQMQGERRNPTTDFLKPSLERWHWKWSEIEVLESSAVLRYTTCLNYYIRLNADWGRIHNGEGHVDGFAQLPGRGSCSSFSTSSGSRCNSSRPEAIHFSRIKNKSNRGFVMDYSGAVGYQFRSNGRRVIITPVVGFSYHHQHLEFHHGKQEIDAFDPFPVLGPIPDLHVNYKPRWYGGFIGVDWEAQVDIPCVLVFGSAEYHWAQYRTTSTWNFADTFINDFNQKGHGQGLILNGGFSYKLQCNFWITAYGTYRNFYAEGGRHKTTSLTNNLLFPRQTFGTFPAFNPRGENRLRHFSWNSWVAGIGFDYRF